MIDKSFDYFFNTCFISLDPNTYMLHSIDSLSKLHSKRPVTTSVSLHTQTGLHCATIQVLNTRDTSLTLVHYNLEHRLAIIAESFSPLNLNHTTSVVKV